MQVFILFYGYEDMEGVFSTEANAENYKELLLHRESYRRRDNFSILEETVDGNDAVMLPVETGPEPVEIVAPGVISAVEFLIVARRLAR